MFLALLILIFIRPFISSPAYPYLDFIYSAVLLASLTAWIMLKRVDFAKIKAVRQALMLFILALLISLVFSQNKLTSIKELYKYICAILLLLAGASLSRKERGRVIFCILIAGFLISLLAMYQYFFGFKRLLGYITKQGTSDPSILDYVSRRRAFFPFVTANILGGYLASLIGLALILKNKAWLIIPLSFALLLSGSLGALASLFLGLAVYYFLKGRLGRKEALFLLGLSIVIGLVFFARGTGQKQHLQPLFSTIMRLNYWQDTLKIIKTYPLTGVGLGNFNLIYSRYAHNSYLQIWAEAGILGLISILCLVILTFKLCLRNIRESPDNNQIACLITACIIFLIHNLIDFSFFLPEVSLIWWLLLGITASFYNKQWLR